MIPRPTGSASTRWSTSVLRELYLTPFERIVAGWRLGGHGGVQQSQRNDDDREPLQRDVLKREWAFDGVIMSDWYATRSVAAAGEDLLDLAMPGPKVPGPKDCLRRFGLARSPNLR